MYVYEDVALAQLNSPAAYKQALHDVLLNPQIGQFDYVIVLTNPTEVEARKAISSFVKEKKFEDISCSIFRVTGFSMKMVN